MLARPALVYPAIFKDTIFDTYKYLLPNLVCAAVVIFGLAVGVLFLEETHEDKKHDPDRGRELGQWLLNKVWRQGTDNPLTDKDGSLDEMTSMLEVQGSRAYSSTVSSPTLCSSRASIAEPLPFSLDGEMKTAPRIREAFTKQVCLSIIGYGVLAL